MLHDRDARTLAWVRRRQRPMLWLGVLLLLVGAGYMLWAVQQVLPYHAVRSSPAFDWPVSSLERLTIPRQERLSRVEPVTPLERTLLVELRAEIHGTNQLLVLVLRILIGSVIATAGLILLAYALAERPLLAIFRRLGI